MSRTVSDAVSGVGGLLLSGATLGVAALRRAPKPLHPRGEVWQGVLTREGGASSRVGVAWLDEPGHDDVLVRRSAAVGLPAWSWDIQGLALRLPQWEGADILLASTGAGPWSRFVLLPARAARISGYTSLLPYPTPVGPVFLRAEPAEKERHVLSYALGRGDWVRFGELRLIARSPEDPSFDPVRSPHPELGNYRWVERLRAPAYVSARRSRGEQ
ncbi:hypothetical protein IEQ44_13835 [Nocardioides sp. Y6]|uniref:Phosphodiesterase n=1 Tax=Nocardioides malaquae TaxID=2773426 RepID=A0ABR9RVV2_9ACTN|nr:hypothetical protein [Nocardioides malaquae]MBE7325729.1 hypothetical protein [Nocardioides malaquae]